eukprot:gene5772-6962_t
MIGSAQCGECPAGYTGDGNLATGPGCEDVDECASSAVEGGGPCWTHLNDPDLAAPCFNTVGGLQCGVCPPGYHGDGAVLCRPIALSCNSTGEGGAAESPCDPLATCDDSSGQAVCGECPEGFAGSGASQCRDEDGCASSPCFLASMCTDVAAPGTGHVCAECPEGYVGDGRSCHVDVCQDASQCSPLVLTSRYVKVHVLRLEAAVSADLAEGAGGGPGQHLLVEYEFRNLDPKTFDVGFVQSVRGAVARAFSLDMENATIASATREKPYPAVAVTLGVPMPAANPTCSPCPDGYQGSGVTGCRLMSSACDVDNGGCWTTNGAEFATCVVNAEGVAECGPCPSGYQGDGSQVGVSYTVALWAWMVGNPRVTSRSNLQNRRRLFAETAALSTSTLSFYVESLPIVIVISGGDTAAGSGNTITLNATLSYDPDGEEGPITFRWACDRDDQAGPCLYPNGTKLSTKLVGPALVFALEGGSQSYINYTFTVWASKGARESVERTSLRIMQGATPVPSLTTVLGKVNPTEKFSTRAEVHSAYPQTVTMDWQIATDDPEAAVALDNTTLLTTADQVDLVLRPHVLHAGATYTLTLAVRDKIGPAAASMRLRVNAPPTRGGVVVHPTDAMALVTSVEVAAPGWYDEDLPLMYKFSYRVVGKRPQQGIPADGLTPLTSEFVPLGSPYSMAVEMSECGEPDHGFAVEMWVSVLDSIGATASAATNMTVAPLSREFDRSLLIDKAADLLQNGDMDRAMRYVQGISIAMNEDPGSVSIESAAEMLAAAEQMREAMMDLTVQMQHMVAPSTSSVEALASTGGSVVSEPSQVNTVTLASGLGLFADLVDWTLSSATEAVITDHAAGSTCTSLGDLSLATESNHIANATGDVDARMNVLQERARELSMLPTHEALSAVRRRAAAAAAGSAAAATASAASAQLAVAPAEECRAAAAAIGFVAEQAAAEAEAARMAASNAAVAAEAFAIVVRSEHGGNATSAALASQAAREAAQAGVEALALARAADAVIKRVTEEPALLLPPPPAPIAAPEATVTAQYRLAPSLQVDAADPTFQASIAESIGARIHSLPPQISVHWVQAQGGWVQVAATAPMATLEAARQSALNLSHSQEVFSGNILASAHTSVETEGVHVLPRASLMDSAAALVVRYRFEPSVLSMEDALTEALLAAVELEIATAVGATSSYQVATTQISSVAGARVVLAVRVASLTQGEALRHAETLSQPSVAVFVASEGSEIAQYHPALDSLEVALKAREEPKVVVEAAYRFAGRLTLSNASWTLQRSVAESVAAAVAWLDAEDVRAHWAELVAVDGREVVEIHVKVDLAHAHDASAVARQLLDATAVFSGSLPPVAAYLPADDTLIGTTFLWSGTGAGATNATLRGAILLQVVYRFSQELDVGTATGILFGKQVAQGVTSAVGGSSGVWGEVSVSAVELSAAGTVEVCVSVSTSVNSSDDPGGYLPTLTSLSDGASVFEGTMGVSEYTPVGVATRIVLPTGGLQSTALLPSASSLAQGKPYIQATARYRFGAELSMADAVGEEFLHGLVECVASASELPMNMTAVMSVTVGQDARVVVMVAARTEDLTDPEALVRMTLALSDVPKVMSQDSRLRRHVRYAQSLGVAAWLEGAQPAVGVDHQLQVHYNLGLGRWEFDDAALEASRASVEAAARVNSPFATVRVLALTTDDAQAVSVGFVVEVDSQRTRMDLLLSALSDSQAVFALSEVVPSDVTTIKVGTAEHVADFPQTPPASVNVTYAFGPELTVSHVDPIFLESMVRVVASAAAVPITSVATSSLRLASDNTVALSVRVAVNTLDAAVVCASMLSNGTAVFGAHTASGRLFASVTMTGASVVIAATPEDRSMRDTGVTVSAVYRFGASLAVTALDELFFKRVQESVYLATEADVAAIQHVWVDAALRVSVRVQADAMDAAAAAACSRILQDAHTVFSAQEEVSRHAPLAVEVTTTPYGVHAPPPLPPAPPSPDADEVTRQEELGRIAVAAAESSMRATETATWLATEAAGAAGMANFSSQALADLEARAVNGTRNSTAPSPGASLERRQRAVAVTTEALETMHSVGTSLLLGVVPGERHQDCGTSTLSMRVQRDRSDLSSSPLYDPIRAPAGTSAAGALFPPSLGAALAAAVGPVGTNTTALEALVVDTRLVTTITEAHLPGGNGTETSAAAGGGITSLSILTPDDVEINVVNLNDAVEVLVALAPEFAQGHTVGELAAQGTPWNGTAVCTFWNVSLQMYDTAGCWAMPNPAPAEAELLWRNGAEEYGDDLDGAFAKSWFIGNASLMTGCLETFEGVVEGYNGTDAGYRKYVDSVKRVVGGACVLAQVVEDPEATQQTADGALLGARPSSAKSSNDRTGSPLHVARPNERHLAFVGTSGIGIKVVALEEALCPETSRREKASVLVGCTGPSGPPLPELALDVTACASDAPAKPALIEPQWRSEELRWTAAWANLCGDNKAQSQEELEELRPPELRKVSARDMAAISAEDVLASKALLATTLSIIAAACYVAVVMSWKDLQERMQFQATLGQCLGTGRYSCKRVGRMWIWGILEEARDAEQSTIQSRAERRLMRALRKEQLVTMLDEANVAYPKAARHRSRRRGIMLQPLEGEEDPPETLAEQGVKRRHSEPAAFRQSRDRDSTTRRQRAQSAFTDSDFIPDSQTLVMAAESESAFCGAEEEMLFLSWAGVQSLLQHSGEAQNNHSSFTNSTKITAQQLQDKILWEDKKLTEKSRLSLPMLMTDCHSRPEKPEMQASQAVISVPMHPEQNTSHREAGNSEIDTCPEAHASNWAPPPTMRRTLRNLGMKVDGGASSQGAQTPRNWIESLQSSIVQISGSAQLQRARRPTRARTMYVRKLQQGDSNIQQPTGQGALEEARLQWETSVEEDTRKVAQFASRSGLLHAPAAGREEKGSSGIDRLLSKLSSIDPAHCDP